MSAVADTVLVIGGTTEARAATRRLEREGYRVIVSVATSLGELFATDAEVVAGRKDEKAMAQQVEECGARVIVDCSHPFAISASGAARRAAAAAGIPYLRFTRAAVAAPAGAVEVETWSDAVDYLRDLGGRSLLTIGVRHLEEFAAAGIDFAARVLPLTESIDECYRVGLRPEDIIAAFPPYDIDFNRACIRKVGARAIVTKDSGREGGIPEKVAAARAEAIPAVIVRRPEAEDAPADLEDLVSRVAEAMADA